ncbi:MAG: hypothetical protein EOP06_15630 [Proteobacteria bacterium]|nr:MAG: hypothetical protein EOP06_15630 [Pseudomonadota bacterium]
MRSLFALFTTLALGTIAVGAPLKKKPDVALKAVPLPPAKLKGKIAFTQNSDLWVIDPNSRQKHLLFRGSYYKTDFATADISRDLTKIAYLRDSPDKPPPHQNPDSALYIMDWNGKNARPLVKYSVSSGLTKPRFSYDGKRIVYLQTYYEWNGTEAVTTLCITNISGARPPKVIRKISTDTPISAFWSFDGTKLLYLSQRGSPLYPESIIKPTFEVATVDATGQIRLPLVDSPSPTFDGDWSRFFLPNVSRDRKKFAHIVEYSGSRGLVISLVNSAGTGTTLASSINGLFLGENEYQDISRVAVTADDTRVVVAGLSVQVDANGFATENDFGHGRYGTPDIWVFDLAGKKPPRLLITKAKLLNWL